MNSIRLQINRRRVRLAVLGLGLGGFFGVLTWSGVEAFQRHAQPVPLAATERADERPSLGERPAPHINIAPQPKPYEEVDSAPRTAVQTIARTTAKLAATPGSPATTIPTAATTPTNADLTSNIKRDRLGKPIIVNGKPWTGKVFDHKPIRPVRTRTMKTTAYSPDARSCGKWADGITASGKSVWMNGGRLVAADRAVPYGTILTIPGYNNEKPVQVWDRGGAIKGNRLDVLYPTHEIALQWGVQDLPVVFWEFVETD